MYKYKDRNWLKKKYVDERLSYSKIAELAGVSTSTIQKYIHRYNIPIRDYSDCHKENLNGEWNNLEINNKTLLKKEYVDRYLTYRDIAEKYNTSIRTVARYIKKFNIKPRKLSDYEITSNRKNDENYICPICGGKKSYGSLKCSKCYLTNLKGSNNPNYKASSSLKRLVRGYIKRVWRPKVFEKDRYICQRCKKYLPGNLQAHHIKRFSVIFEEILKENNHLNPQDEKDKLKLYKIMITDNELNSINNGLTLCEKCHRKVHYGKRKDICDIDCDLYIYDAKIIDVYDCDTVTAKISLGFDIYKTAKIRLYGINCPEIRTKNKIEKEVGYESRDFLRDLILEKDVELHTYKDGKYGRILADIYLDGILINDKLIECGYAHPYFGGKRESWFS